MKKDEVSDLILKKILGNKRGVNVFMSTAKIATSANNAMLSNWTGPINIPQNLSNDPASSFWFAFVDHMPNANWEHPVEYIFIDDKTGKIDKVNGTSPPNNLDSLVKIQ
jgi:hypothetical protein